MTIDKFSSNLTGNLTKIEVEILSWYSISASARAVFSTTDHITGLKPKNKSPFSKNFSSSLRIVISESFVIVK